ncbi:MAG: hypothetical protein QM718_01475 [Steroidobacteraceae bacterium]
MPGIVRSMQRGQSAVEYLLGFAVLGLLLSLPLLDGQSVAEALGEALRGRYALLSTWLALL